VPVCLVFRCEALRKTVEKHFPPAEQLGKERQPDYLIVLLLRLAHLPMDKKMNLLF
jgi:hypothetical protein